MQAPSSARGYACISSKFLAYRNSHPCPQTSLSNLTYYFFYDYTGIEPRSRSTLFLGFFPFLFLRLRNSKYDTPNELLRAKSHTSEILIQKLVERRSCSCWTKKSAYLAFLTRSRNPANYLQENPTSWLLIFSCPRLLCFFDHRHKNCLNILLPRRVSNTLVFFIT